MKSEKHVALGNTGHWAAIYQLNEKATLINMICGSSVDSKLKVVLLSFVITVKLHNFAYLSLAH